MCRTLGPLAGESRGNRGIGRLRTREVREIGGLRDIREIREFRAIWRFGRMGESAIGRKRLRIRIRDNTNF